MKPMTIVFAKYLSATLLILGCCHCSAGEEEAKAAKPADERPAGVDTPEVSEAGEKKRVDFPEAGVALVRPDGFENAEGFHGFQDKETSASVMALKIPGPFQEVTTGLNAEQLKSRGMTLHSQENIDIVGQKGMLLHIEQTLLGTAHLKWMVMFGNEKETTMVMAVFPKEHEKDLSARLKSVVMGVRRSKEPPPPIGANVGFTLGETKLLKPARGIGKMLLFTKNGVVPAESPEDPLFVASRSLSKVPILDGRLFALKRLKHTAHTEIGQIKTEKSVTIDGLDGYEIIADATDSGSGTPLVIYQAVLFDDGFYFLMQGLVGKKLSKKYLPEFQKMAHDFARKASEKPDTVETGAE